MFRWKRGVAHALIPFALVIGGGLALLFATHPVDQEKAGEGIGRFACFAAVAGFGISYLAQTGRRKAALWAGIALVAAITALIVAVFATSRHTTIALRAADRAPLEDVVVDGQHRLQHPTFGFSILRPPPSYTTSPEMAAIMENATHDPTMVSYAYAETPPSGGLIIGIMNDAGESRADLGRAIEGIERGFERSTAGVGGATPLEYLRNDITGDDAHLEAHFHATIAGMHMQINAYVVHPAGRPPAIVTVMVLAPDATTLADVLASFRR